MKIKKRKKIRSRINSKTETATTCRVSIHTLNPNPNPNPTPHPNRPVSLPVLETLDSNAISFAGLVPYFPDHHLTGSGDFCYRGVLPCLNTVKHSRKLSRRNGQGR